MKTYEFLIGLGVASLAIGGWLVTPALAFAIIGLGLTVLGLMLSRETPVTPYKQPVGIDGLFTASPEPDA